MDFAQHKKQVLNLIRRGDIKAIVQSTGINRQTIQESHSRNSLNEMSRREREAWEATINYVEEKRKINEELEKQTAKLSSKLN